MTNLSVCIFANSLLSTSRRNEKSCMSNEKQFLFSQDNDTYYRFIDVDISKCDYYYSGCCGSPRNKFN
jgi:hypothetical protein